MDEIEKLAKDFYTEQRGKVRGNTKAWEELDGLDREKLVRYMRDTLSFMKKAWEGEALFRTADEIEWQCCGQTLAQGHKEGCYTQIKWF